MKQLRDTDLVRRILIGEIVKTGLPEPYCNLTTNDPIWYGKESPIQPSSLDLHIGDIFVPNENPISREHYCLSAGQTVVVTTTEELNLKSNISGFGFPPDKLSQNGILMVNLGHIDPGWQGKVKFVLINVGKEDYPIKKNDIVATFLFFELDEDVEKNYAQRRPNSTFPLTPDVSSIVNSLSKDFLDVNKRAGVIVKKSITFNSAISGIIAAVISLIGYYYGQSFESKIKEVEKEVEKEVQCVKKDYEYGKLKSEVDSLKKEINKFRTSKKLSE